MTTSTATRADQLPVGLCWIAAHGDCPGGLAYVDQSGQHLYGLTGPMWSLRGDDLTQHWGESLVAIPRTLAATTEDPAIRAWAQSSINRTERHS